MKKLFALTLLALATAACDVGVAGSSSTHGSGGDCMKSGGCPTSMPATTAAAQTTPAAAAEDCGMCPSAGKAECKEGSCEVPPMDCETKCETQKDCDSTKQECAPKAGN